ncbi:MAG: UMP kinase [Archaeoglobus sp.]|jgi:uridylate kinase|nr:MAG: UMP kinase [Archaeoglobus sp.]
MKIVLSLGGSVLMSDFPKCNKMRAFAEEVELISNEHDVFVVVGGGKIARDYIQAARASGANNTLCDSIGIEVTRLNAMLFSTYIDSSPKEVPKTFERAVELSKLWNVVVMGGTFPGHTTDATAALLAEYVNADVMLNATSVNGVYSSDPKKDARALRYEKLTPEQLVEIVAKGELKAGSSNVLDLLAAKIIERSKIRTIIFLGEPGNIIKVVKGEFKEIGTLIEP